MQTFFRCGVPGGTLQVLLVGLLLAQVCVAGPYDPPANYYSSATGTGSTLKSQLHNIIDNHTVMSYNDARETLQITDQDPADSDRMLLVYDRVSLDVSAISGSIPGWDSGSSWNREHTWPRSRGVNSSGPDNTDLHQLRPSDPGVNSSRGNLNFGGAFGQPFGEVSDGGDFWYPGDADAGMIARQQFYMATRYDGSDSSTEDLELLSGNPSTSQGMGNLDRLLEWHYLAAPDDFELRRNDVIYDNYQGNRNPFIDRPEYVWSIFEDQNNDSQLFVGGAPASDGSSSLNVDLGSVIVGSAVPGAQNVTLNRNGNDGTYYEVTTSGDATSSVSGRFNTFAINNTGTDSATISVGLSTSTATAGQRSGNVVIDNLDVTTNGGVGVGNQDGNDSINVTLDVVDHSEASFDGLVDSNFLLIDFGSIPLGSASPSIDFDIFNLENTTGYTAGLEVDSILASGDTSEITTNLSTFTDATALAAGSSNSYTASLDTSSLGTFSATYLLSVSDEDIAGATAGFGLTLAVLGEVTSTANADFDGSGEIDAIDYLTLQRGLGVGTTLAEGDADGNNQVDGADLVVWESQFGQSALTVAVQTVPEPTSGLLLTMAIAWLVLPRRA